MFRSSNIRYSECVCEFLNIYAIYICAICVCVYMSLSLEHAFNNKYRLIYLYIYKVYMILDASILRKCEQFSYINIYLLCS